MRVSATRLHSANAKKTSIEIDDLKRWCDQVLSYCDYLIIAVDAEYASKFHDELAGYNKNIRVITINSWISYTHPLNTILEEAMHAGANEILFQSIEVVTSIQTVRKLKAYLKDDTLVIGAKLSGHCWDDDKAVAITGSSTPWNTLALWNVKKLGLTGFLSVSSGSLVGIPGGVEEAVTISLLQHLNPNTMKAKIVNIADVVWKTQWECNYRTNYHNEKIASKDLRSKIQLDKLGIASGLVEIVDDI